MSWAALNGGKRHVDVLARGCWSTSSGNPRTADVAHRRRFDHPWLGPAKIGGWEKIDAPFPSIPTAWLVQKQALRISTAVYGEDAVDSLRRLCLRLHRRQQALLQYFVYTYYEHGGTGRIEHRRLQSNTVSDW